MNKQQLAKLALRERRAGRNPTRVLSAAIGPEGLTPGQYGSSSSDVSQQLHMITVDASERFGIPLSEMMALVKRIGVRASLMEPGYIFQLDHVRQWGDEIKRMLLEADWFDGEIKEKAY